MDAMSAADRAWPILRRLTGIHTTVYRLTSGLVGHRLPVPEQLPELPQPLRDLVHPGARDHQHPEPGHLPRGLWSPMTFTDRLVYTQQATTHLDGLDPQTLLVGLTCHA